MFGVDRFDAILPPSQVRTETFDFNYHFTRMYINIQWSQGAIMAVGASKPTVVADKDGFFSVKRKMLVS